VRTGGILSVVGGVTAAVGALVALQMLRWSITEKGQGFAFLLGFVVFGAVAAGGLAALVVGRRRLKLEDEEAARGFEELVLALAGRFGGQVKVEQICQAASITKVEAEARMRRLTGRGLFELDFDGNGQPSYKAAPSLQRH
jgi:hypothetical protein